MESKKEVIEKMYFEEHLQLTKIAKEINTSISYVSKVLRLNENYNLEKEKRKSLNLVNRRQTQKKLIYANRKRKVDLDYLIIKKQHEQASRELSKKSKLGDTALRKWSSVYKYNPLKNRFEFNANGLLKPADYPSYIRI